MRPLIWICFFDIHTSSFSVHINKYMRMEIAALLSNSQNHTANTECHAISEMEYIFSTMLTPRDSHMSLVWVDIVNRVQSKTWYCITQHALCFPWFYHFNFVCAFVWWKFKMLAIKIGCCVFSLLVVLFIHSKWTVIAQKLYINLLIILSCNRMLSVNFTIHSFFIISSFAHLCFSVCCYVVLTFCETQSWNRKQNNNKTRERKKQYPQN